METIEQKTAKSLLQTPERVVIGKKTFTVARPSVATLIMASAAISKLPKIEIESDNVVGNVLRVAKDTESVGDIVAIMIMGAKGMNCIGIRRWIKQWRMRRVKRLVLDNLDATELQKLTYQLFAGMHIADFFGLIAFLGEINMAKPTKAITTASGQQSAVS